MMKDIGKKTLIIIVPIIVILIVSFFVFKGHNKKYIDKVLSKTEYSYLPVEAKNYIKNIYKQTGEVMLTEKNKVTNEPYLNPMYVEYLVMSPKEKADVENIPMATVIDYAVSEESDSSIPSSYSLANDNGNNYVTPVRNQGNLGLCWAFSSAGVAESHLLKKSDTSYTSNAQLIAERQLDYATASDAINDYNNEYVSFIDRSLGSGGNFYISSVVMASGVSLFDYNSFKSYNDSDKSRMELPEVLSYNKSLYELNSSVNLPLLNLRVSTGSLSTDEVNFKENYLNEVKQYIMDNGALYVSTYMDNGCYYTDSSLNNTVIDVYNCSMNEGHAMQIIGWDDDKEYSYCADTTAHKSNTSGCSKIVRGKGVWILKNSWGSTMPNPYLAYDSNYTTISTIEDMVPSEEKNWDNNYILGSESEIATNVEYAFSNTKIRGNESLKKIKFFTNEVDSSYSIKVLKKDGEYENYSINNHFPGLVTIDTNGIIVDQNSTVTIQGGKFIDKVILFTSNEDKEPYISMEDYDYIMLSDYSLRLYSETRNIQSGSNLIYKLYDEYGDEVTNYFSYSNGQVAENNVNPLLVFDKKIPSGDYRLDVLYNSNVINSVHLGFSNMTGSGTKSDPYVITNTTQFNQIRYDLDAYYALGADLDFSVDTRYGGKFSYDISDGVGFGWTPIEGFSGSLDGRGHKITGLYLHNNVKTEQGSSRRNINAGLFGTVHGSVSFTNIVLDNFDISSFNYCGALFAAYKWSDPLQMSDLSEYNVYIDNVSLINSTITGNNYYMPYVGGLFATIDGNNNGHLTISNIYMNSTVKSDYASGYLAKMIDAFAIININNIFVNGEYLPAFSDGSGSGVLFETLHVGDGTTNISNVLSTIDNSNVGGKLGGTVWINDGSLNVRNIRFLNIGSRDIFYRNDSSEKTSKVNVTSYDIGSEFSLFTERNTYISFDGIDEDWIIKEVDGIKRLPVLKDVDFTYTSIPNVSLDITTGETVNIYDLITPQIAAAKRVKYNMKNSSIASIDENGVITPHRVGNTLLHVKSLYDGYEKDIAVSITAQKYNVKFDANNGTGSMDDLVVLVDNEVNLPKNTFERSDYTFIGWNTKPDGTGDSYSDEGKILNLASNNDTITLYAMWEKNGGYAINNYFCDKTMKYISRIPINTTVDVFMSNIDLADGFSVEVDSKDINGSQIIYTGGKTKIYENGVLMAEYTNAVKGDVNGDGSLNSADLLKIRQHLLETIKLSGVYFLSSDVNYDNSINSADLLRVRQHLLGTKPII